MRKLCHNLLRACYRTARKCGAGVLLVFAHVRIRFAVRRIAAVRGRPLKVAFLVVFDSVFPLENVFRLMLSDRDFDPHVVVIPDVSRGNEHRDRVMQQTFANLRGKYGGRVTMSNDDGHFKDVSRAYDLYATMNPYSGMTHRFYSIPYLALKGCLVFASRYFTDTGTIYSRPFNTLLSLAWLWRFYAEDERDADNIRDAQRWLRRRNAVVAVGCPKMDAFKPVSSRSGRKCVIIAPHHSIDPIGANGFTIANFPRYADFFLKLPEMYEQIDWVFRPHPLLFSAMMNSGRWTKSECDSWLDEMTSHSNVRYEAGGEYLETFAKSDGIIQDCSSFLPEYFCTGMPQCYLLKSKESEAEQFAEYGRQLLSHTYKAYSEADVISFIDNVIIQGLDEKRGGASALRRRTSYVQQREGRSCDSRRHQALAGHVERLQCREANEGKHPSAF